jgi:citronellyl-CoA dehydrogenase
MSAPMTVPAGALGAPGSSGWFNATEDELRTAMSRHLADSVEPLIAGWEAAGTVDLRAVLAGLARRGWLGMRFPTAVGGGGGSVWDHVVLAECLGGLSSDSVGMSVTVHNDMVAPMIADSGRSEAVDRFLRPALTGQYVLAHAVSEAGAGSDVSAVAMTATPVTGGYRVTGVKQWVIAGRYADAFAVLAALPDARGPFGHVLLMVGVDEPGVTVTPAADTLGLRAAGLAGTVELVDTYVPEEYRLGGHGTGLVLQLRQFEQERILSACRAVAISARLLDLTRARLAGRSTFGAPVGTRADVRSRLAALATEVEAVRQLAYTAADRWATGGEYRTLSAAVKLRSSRLARSVGWTCLHLYGAAGQLASAEVNRAWRDARLFSISTGSDEMMLTSIARLCGWERDR